jgi:hypothetical protein
MNPHFSMRVMAFFIILLSPKEQGESLFFGKTYKTQSYDSFLLYQFFLDFIHKLKAFPKEGIGLF